MASENRTTLAASVTAVSTAITNNLTSKVSITKHNAILTEVVNALTDVKDSAWLLSDDNTVDDSSSIRQIITGTTNGLRIGSSVSNKLGFFGATPVVQPSNANQGALTNITGTSSLALPSYVNLTSLTDNSNGTADGTVDATHTITIPTWGDTTSVNQATNLTTLGTNLNANFAKIDDNFAEMAAELALQRTLNTNLQNAIASLATVINQGRTDKVALGLIKGSA